ncbi:MAG: cation:proton antiporter, partial [Cyanobacteria bacterium J06559_3]
MLAFSSLTIVWMALPFFIGFSSVLMPLLARPLALGIALVSTSYATYLCVTDASVTLHLLDQSGVTRHMEALSG